MRGLDTLSGIQNETEVFTSAETGPGSVPGVVTRRPIARFTNTPSPRREYSPYTQLGVYRQRRVQKRCRKRAHSKLSHILAARRNPTVKMDANKVERG